MLEEVKRNLTWLFQVRFSDLWPCSERHSSINQKELGKIHWKCLTPSKRELGGHHLKDYKGVKFVLNWFQTWQDSCFDGGIKNFRFSFYFSQFAPSILMCLTNCILLSQRVLPWRPNWFVKIIFHHIIIWFLLWFAYSYSHFVSIYSDNSQNHRKTNLLVVTW